MLVGQCKVILTKPDQRECVRLKLVVIRASTGRYSSLIWANALVIHCLLVSYDTVLVAMWTSGRPELSPPAGGSNVGWLVSVK